MMQSNSGAETLTENAETSPNPTDPGKGFWAGLSSLLLEPVSQRLSAGVGMVGGLLHVQEGVESLLQSIGLAADCNASTNCTDAQAQAIEATAQSGAMTAYVGEVVAITHSSTFAGSILGTIEQEAESGQLASNSAEAASLYATVVNNGLTQNALQVTQNLVSQPTFSDVNGHLGIATGTAQITNSQGVAAAQSSLNLCCFGAAQLGITGLADPAGNYDLLVPIGVANTNYPGLSINVFDPFTSLTLASTIVDLSGISPTATVKVPTMTGVCSDSDAFSGDLDDPDCD